MHLTKKIYDLVQEVQDDKFYVPNIQRGFVWSTDQIETLFDSLMRDYPISTFLFWEVNRHRVEDFTFYKFFSDYHEKDSLVEKVNPSRERELIAVLDGQQRMTSILIGLTGYYAKRAPYKRDNHPDAYPEKRLYLNLAQTSPDIDRMYDFRFLTNEEAQSSDGFHWFPLSEIMEMKSSESVFTYMSDHGLFGSEIGRFAGETLSKLQNLVHQKEIISYYLEKTDSLDKVLQIFIRINSGGTKLDYSDLLLSIASAQWDSREAREVINNLVTELNGIGNGFAFNKDIILKSCLVLCDLDVKFKVDNFSKPNMTLIESKWDKIENALRASVELLAKLGFNKDNLAAKNALIPIAYFVYANDFYSSIVRSSHRNNDRKAIKEYIARALLKGVYGGQPDSIYPGMREIIKANPGEFPLSAIIDHYRGTNKSLVFGEDDIDTLLDLKYGQSKTFCALSLLYPGLNFSCQYHQDHIHPKSLFKKKQLRDAGIPVEQVPAYLNEFNKIANLQLLEATLNVEKKDLPFEEWLNAFHGDQGSINHYLSHNLIKPEQSLKLEDFLAFIEVRKNTMKHHFRQVLKVKSGEDNAPSNDATFTQTQTSSKEVTA